MQSRICSRDLFRQIKDPVGRAGKAAQLMTMHVFEAAPTVAMQADMAGKGHRRRGCVDEHRCSFSKPFSNPDFLLFFFSSSLDYSDEI